jgi:hypothetical protein
MIIKSKRYFQIIIRIDQSRPMICRILGGFCQKRKLLQNTAGEPAPKSMRCLTWRQPIGCVVYPHVLNRQAAIVCRWQSTRSGDSGPISLLRITHWHVVIRVTHISFWDRNHWFFLRWKTYCHFTFKPDCTCTCRMFFIRFLHGIIRADRIHQQHFSVNQRLIDIRLRTTNGI